MNSSFLSPKVLLLTSLSQLTIITTADVAPQAEVIIFFALKLWSFQHPQGHYLQRLSSAPSRQASSQDQISAEPRPSITVKFDQ